ncbi:coil containing protein [Vibrio phage 1.271.B._10N.286.54.B4]|nr:coil containing protein [Vibrio phage 1.027.O._10N.286.54.B8]AUR92369.1 coil containing protein [Vibrio phage 1.171.O._10N.261.52.F12]AUR94422.1 coil containing protein [Vibrio phage 1.194.O._10N.286.54.B1]AUR94595.1 coil containing protein [Vibrio phage 1.196.O._10N.286.54.E12]AUR95062.1 coil containing protein [Vibrio phage 1.200.O._10N.286.55.E1]AUR99550.1 coil containing protein [Vibrio phage 1.267.O._10N.286.54.A1]AUR99635.1 coil containing protein [Vibrio phage 1.268.A._10N.286.54.A1
MAVGIDIVVDPSGAVSGGRTAVTSLDKIETQADMTTASVNKTNAAITATGPAAQNMSKQVDSSSASMKKFNGFVGAAGFQVSDMAIQLGMGANAAMVFGIQGGQLLGFLSPIAGALATVSGILIGQFTGGMYAGAEATRELDDALVRTNEEINELTKTQARFAQATLSESLNDDYKALLLAKEEAKELRKEYDAFQKQREEFEKNPPAFGGGFIEGFIGLADVGDKLKESEQNVEDLQGRVNNTIDTMQKYGQVLEGNKLKEDDNADAIRRRTDSVTSLSQNLIVLQTRISGNNREAAVQEAVFRSGAEAGSDYAAQISLLAGQQYDLQQQLSATNDAVSEFDQDGAYIAKLQQQVGLINETSREQALLRAEYSLSEQATATQIEQARQLAGALYDQTEAKRAQVQAEREAKQEADQATQFSMGIVGDATGLEALEQKRQIVLEYQEQELGDAQAHAAALVSLERQALTERASITSSGLGSILALQQAYGDDSSGIYRTLLTVQKAATLYSVLLSSQETIGKAWASAPFPANLPAVATATVETGALAATVQALTPSFATGGLAYGPGTGTSDSFTANLSNGEFVMPQRETMRNLGTLQSMRAGNDVTGNSAPNIQIVNQTTGKIDSASASWVDSDTVRVLIREEVPGLLAAEVNDEYSQYNKAQQSQYVTQRKF